MSADVVSSKNINERLDAFRAEMFAKFKRVEHKHRGSSVTDDNVDWMTFEWSQIEGHFIAEIGEFFNLNKEETDQLRGLIWGAENRNDPKSEKEAIDVGNMAFLLWWYLSQGKQP